MLLRLRKVKLSFLHRGERNLAFFQDITVGWLFVALDVFLLRKPTNLNYAFLRRFSKAVNNLFRALVV